MIGESESTRGMTNGSRINRERQHQALIKLVTLIVGKRAASSIACSRTACPPPRRPVVRLGVADYLRFE
jgi:hypothetical protein